MVVVVIIGIFLATIAIPVYNNVTPAALADSFASGEPVRFAGCGVI
jgi:Tfp pilus assembly major pilin PilA